MEYYQITFTPVQNFFSQNKYPLRSVSSGKLKCIPSRTKSFSKTFFPYCIDERNKLNPEVRNA